MIWLLIKFYNIFIKRIMLGKYSNFLVWLHTRLTPTRAVESPIIEAILDEIRFRQRKVEQKRWDLWIKLESLGEKLGVYSDEDMKQSQLYKSTEVYFDED